VPCAARLGTVNPHFTTYQESRYVIINPKESLYNSKRQLPEPRCQRTQSFADFKQPNGRSKFCNRNIDETDKAALGNGLASRPSPLGPASGFSPTLGPNHRQPHIPSFKTLPLGVTQSASCALRERYSGYPPQPFQVYLPLNRRATPEGMKVEQYAVQVTLSARSRKTNQRRTILEGPVASTP
jgi:hypothetical protein